VLRLQGYDFKVVYRPGKTNIADALSRLNSVKQLDCGEKYNFIRTVVENCVPVALSLKEIKEASYSDEELCLLKNCVKSGNSVRFLHIHTSKTNYYIKANEDQDFCLCGGSEKSRLKIFRNRKN